MPSIVYIHPPHSPVRRMPKNVRMNTIDPSPWRCLLCNSETVFYADGVVWCKKCEKKLLDHERVDTMRGIQKDSISPGWKPLPLK